jgi:hypothetical protein
MIEISKLTEKDIGRWVEYQDHGGRNETGRIKSWNEAFIFVVYSCNNEWERFQDFTGQPTRPEDLLFIEDKK